MAKNSKFKRPAPFKGKTSSGKSPAGKTARGKSRTQKMGDLNQLSKSTGKADVESAQHKTNKQIDKSVDKSVEKPKRSAPAKHRLAETIGLILESAPDKNYALLDSGDGQKLERYENYHIIRPEGQAIWQKSLSPKQWQNVDAIFTGDTDEEGMGRWAFPKKQLNETWPMAFDGVPFFGRFTSFRHTGVFPEQAAHWRFMVDVLKSAQKDKKRKDKPKVLNLFGYTGVASLVAANAGAHVTHVDASKKAIGWAKENQELAGLQDKPIRWICEDAVKFCEREVRRGNTYDAILLDPPAYGRGPKGEVWQMFEDCPHLVDLCQQLMSKEPLFVVLTSYAIRASFLSIHELMQEVFGDMRGELHSGELVIRTDKSERKLSTSMFSRWLPNSVAENINKASGNE